MGTAKSVLETLAGTMADNIEIFVPVYPEAGLAIPEIREDAPPALDLSHAFVIKLKHDRETLDLYRVNHRDQETLAFYWTQGSNTFVAKLRSEELTLSKTEYRETLIPAGEAAILYQFAGDFKIITHMTKWVNYFVAETQDREIAPAGENEEEVDANKVVVLFKPKTAGISLFRSKSPVTR